MFQVTCFHHPRSPSYNIKRFFLLHSSYLTINKKIISFGGKSSRLTDMCLNNKRKCVRLKLKMSQTNKIPINVNDSDNGPLAKVKGGGPLIEWYSRKNSVFVFFQVLRFYVCFPFFFYLNLGDNRIDYKVILNGLYYV